MTGLTSIGLSTKKQSKISEELDLNFNQEQVAKKIIISPVVALDKRVPQKSMSKSSSKKSGKKKGQKREPKKYSHPNITREKLSNKSVVAEIANKEMLLDKSAGKVISGPIQSSKVLDDDWKEKLSAQQKAANRFTISNINMKDVERSGIILEDKNEYSENSSDDDSSEAKSVSSLQTKEKQHESVSDNDELDGDYLPAPLALLGQKNVSEWVQMKNKIFNNDNEFISKALGSPLFSNSIEGLMKKDDNFVSWKNSNLMFPQTKFESISAWQKSNCNFEESIPSTKTMNLPQGKRSIQSHQGFYTDIQLLKMNDQKEKSKKVLSRLKMMI